MTKRGCGRGRAPLIQELAGAHFQRVAFDETGKRFILVLVDYYTKRAAAYDLVDHKATTVADTITCNWIAHHGVPLRLHCDNSEDMSLRRERN